MADEFPSGSLVNPDGLKPFWLARSTRTIFFFAAILTLAGSYLALQVPISVFPATDFPRVVIGVDNGVMPADEMMAAITRPIEESLKDIPGAIRVRSTTGRGSAEISVFFNWKADMAQSELYVNSRMAQIRATLPSTVTASVRRLTFSAFPIMGVSLTSPQRSTMELWETARYDIKPRLLRIPGVARVDIVGGRAPEYHVIADPLKLQSLNLSLAQIADALSKNNIIAPTGMHEENHTLYLAVVDGRARNISDIENLIVSAPDSHPARVKDFARGCMRTYLILKEKAAQFNSDKEIQALLTEINADDGSMDPYLGKYTGKKAAALRAQTFNRKALGERGLKYERLDQLTIDLILGDR